MIMFAKPHSISQLCTHWHRRWRRRSAVACELPAGHTAHHGVHAAPARPVAPGVGELSTALRQRVLYTLTLNLLHPVALLGDLSPQPDGGKWEKITYNINSVDIFIL